MSLNFSKGLPQNNVRYRNSKKPEEKVKTNKKSDQVKKLSVLEEMEQMKHRREERKKRIEDEKQHKKDLINDPNYIPKLDYDFEFLIQQKKKEVEYIDPEPHSTSEGAKIYVCVRKRPIFEKEIQNGEIDCVSAINPKVCIYDCKLKIDGYTKYIDTNDFYFDNVFNENETTDLLFDCGVKPTLDVLLKGGVVTCFAYGQTGSGKTFTMKGIQDEAIDAVFDEFEGLKKETKKKFKFFVSFFEIYSGRLYDLLNNRNKVMALEDKNQKVQIYGLTEKEVFCPKDMQDIVDYANEMRTTKNTVTNETSSRSHAICNFVIKLVGKKSDEEYAKLSLVDLAGSERATETQSNDKSRLAEGAEINKSLLALKECIRALDERKKGNNEQHVPFRNSKLTLVLRDSFLGKADLCKIIMISCVSPSNQSSNHTINTLRYADRLKEKTSTHNNFIQKKPAAGTIPVGSKPPLLKEKDEDELFLGGVDSLGGSKSQKKLIKGKNEKVKNDKINKVYTMSGGVPNVNGKNIKTSLAGGINKINAAPVSNFNVANNSHGGNNYFSRDKKQREKNKKLKKEDKKDNNNNSVEKKINNYFDDVEDLDEDDMQKLNLKPTPICEPSRRKNFAPKKKKFVLQKKTKTDRTESNNLSNNLANKNIANELDNLNLNKISGGNNFVENNLDNADIDMDKDLRDLDLNNLNNINIKEIHDNQKLNEGLNEDDFAEPKEEKIKVKISKEEEDEDEDDNNNENIEISNNESNNNENENEAEVDENEIIEKKPNDEPSTKNETELKEEEASNNDIPDIIDEQEALIGSHVSIIKSEASLLTEEGNLISKIKGINDVNYSMDEYVPKIEEIILLKLKYFKELKQKIKDFKSLEGQ